MLWISGLLNVIYWSIASLKLLKEELVNFLLASLIPLNMILFGLKTVM